MAFSEDLSIFVNPDTPGYAPAVIGAAPVAGIFSNNYADFSGFVGGSNPTLLCQSADIPTVTNGTALTINGTDYTVAGAPQPDGTGLTLLQLQVT